MASIFREVANEYKVGALDELPSLKGPISPEYRSARESHLQFLLPTYLAEACDHIVDNPAPSPVELVVRLRERVEKMKEKAKHES